MKPNVPSSRNDAGSDTVDWFMGTHSNQKPEAALVFSMLAHTNWIVGCDLAMRLKK